jgi:hypothetical protein
LRDNDHEESGDNMKKATSASKEGKGGDSPSQMIDARIAGLAIGGARRSRGFELSSERPTPKSSKR